jgi:hypothetical protein
MIMFAADSSIYVRFGKLAIMTVVAILAFVMFRRTPDRTPGLPSSLRGVWRQILTLLIASLAGLIVALSILLTSDNLSPEWVLALIIIAAVCGYGFLIAVRILRWYGSK